jgi:hypothetical protein
MDVDAITRQLAVFAQKHKRMFDKVAARGSQLLELGTVVAVEQHYASNGFKTFVLSPQHGKDFVVKLGTRGNPWNFSRIVMERGGDVAEVHMNLLVRSAHDDGVYCVDVGVTDEGAVPNRVARPTRWECLENERLRSFAEAKRLVIYPMLLAQFVGIVHEIKPGFLTAPGPPGFDSRNHLSPTLVALGHYSANAQSIVRSYVTRGINVCVAESFDLRLAAHRSGHARSPLYWDTGRDTTTHE